VTTDVVLSGQMYRRWLLLFACAAAAAFGLSLLTGAGAFGLGPAGAARWLILTEIRLPRTVLGALTGAALGLSGATLQGYLRNPLAEPGLLGVSSGAALGAVLSIHLGFASALALALPVAGLIGAALATFAVFLLAGERSGPATLILAGVAVSALCAALTSLALNLARNPFAAAESIFWMMGSLADRSMVQVWLAGPLIVIGIVFLLRTARALDGLTLGDDTARTLGLDLTAARRHIILGTALSVGAATAVTGMIGFVGLIVPHVLRPVVGSLPSRLLVPSMLCGAAAVLLADIVLRLIAPIVEVRIGVLTALIGAPFFVWLVVRLRQDLTP
jgi:iron complex transport system permease protein